MSSVPSMPLISSSEMRPWAKTAPVIVQKSFLSVYFWFTTYLFLLAVQLKFAKQETLVFLVFDETKVWSHFIVQQCYGGRLSLPLCFF